MKTYKEIRNILTLQERKKIGWFLFPLIIGTLLEMFALGIIMPAIYLMIKPNILNNYTIMHPILERLGNPSHSKLIVIGVLGIVIIYFFKTLFITYLIWKQNKLVNEIRAGISSRLFHGYMYQPWKFYLQKNSAQLTNNILHEINLFNSNVLSSIITLLTEGLIFLGIIIILLFVQPLGTLFIIGSIGFIPFIFHKLAKIRILHWGKQRQFHDSLRFQCIQEGLGSAKDIKILGRESYFYKRFQIHNLASSHVSQHGDTIEKLPRLWLEWLAVIALTLLILVLLKKQENPDWLIATVGLFAAAAFRIIPSITRIIESIHRLVFSLPIIHILYNEFKTLEDPLLPVNNELLRLKHQITIHQVYYKYQNAKHDTLIDINLQIPAGSSIGFIGASGAGKSTLVDIILGLLQPDKGQVKVDDIDIQTNIRGWQNQIGFVPQSIYLCDNSLRSNIAFGIEDEMIDDKAIANVIKIAQLEDFINTLPNGLDTQVGERGIRLSGGQRQRIGIARALYHDPDVLIFDESTNALDTLTEQDIMKSINALHGKKTILIIAHRLSSIVDCDYIYKLKNGKIIDHGTFKQVTKGRK